VARLDRRKLEKLEAKRPKPSAASSSEAEREARSAAEEADDNLLVDIYFRVLEDQERTSKRLEPLPWTGEDRQRAENFLKDVLPRLRSRRIWRQGHNPGKLDRFEREVLERLDQSDKDLMQDLMKGEVSGFQQGRI
jgi:hypothetical protein